MPQTLQSLRVSVPEIVYAKLEEPKSPDLRVALDGLGRLFDVSHEGSTPRYANWAWSNISDAMIEDPSGIVLPGIRPEAETAKRVLEVVREFPWLRQLSETGSDSDIILEREFFDLFRGHTVDDYPGLFGVTLREAKVLRMRSQQRDYDLHALAEQAGLHEQPGF